MLRLLTLGTVELRAADGRALHGVLRQPKRLAVLMYLVLREPGGLHQRNALLPIFWPESDEAHARSTLRNALHFLRTALGPSVLVSRGAEEIGIDPAALWCDAIAFEQAAREGRADEALSLWRGPLLDGFLPHDIPEFSDWLDRRRNGLTSRATELAREQTERVVAAGDHGATVIAARRWMELAPFDERAILRLVHALESDRQKAQAIEAIDAWCTRYDREIGTPPAAALTVIARRLRPKVSPVVHPVVQQEVAALPAIVHEAPKRSILRGLRAPRRAALLALLPALLLTGLGVGALFRPRGTAAVGPATLAVLPFGYAGVAEHGYLREAVPELLSTRLDGYSNVRIVDARTVLAGASRGSARITPNLGDAGKLARRFSADYFVVGTVTEVGPELQVSAALHRTSGPVEPIIRMSARGNTDHLFEMADSLVHALRRATVFAQHADSIAGGGNVGTTSIAALQAFVVGDVAFNEGRYGDAALAYRRAVEADPGFARAYIRLSMADHWLGRSAPVLEPIKSARAHADRLDADGRRLLEAWSAHMHALPIDAETLYTRYLDAHPGDADAWFQLGEVRMHWGPSFGVAPAKAEDAFRRTLSLLPDHAAALIHMLRLAGRSDSVDKVNRIAGALLQLNPEESERIEAQLVRALSQRPIDTAAIDRALADPSPEAFRQLRVMLPTLAASIPRPSDAVLVARRLHIETSSDDVGIDFVSAGLLEAAAGRFRSAAASTTGFPSSRALRGLEFRALYAALPFAPLVPASIAALRDSVRRLPRDKSDPMTLVPSSTSGIFLPRRLLLDALLSLRVGDTASANADASELDSLERVPTVRPGFARDYAGVVRAMMLIARNRPDSALAVLGPPRVESNNIYPPITSWGKALERLTRADALARLGRDDEALHWLDGIPDNDGYDIAFVAPAQLAAARIERHRGNMESAKKHYARAVELWRDADRAPPPLER